MLRGSKSLLRMFAKTQRGTREGGKRRGKNENEEERWRGDGGGGAE